MPATHGGLRFSTTMLHRFFSSSLLTQILSVALLAFAVHVLVVGIGVNIVMYNYCLGGHAFLNGLDPYAETLKNGVSNQFKYSPLFAVISGGMAKGLAKHAHQVAGLWVLASTLMFALGLRRWCDLAKPAPFYLIFAFAAAIVDLFVSTGVYQANAICIGLLLIGLAEYRDGRFFTAGLLLLLASNFKVYPVIFFLAFLLKFKRNYWLGALIAGVAAFSLPAFFAGWSHNWNMHWTWVKLVLNDTGTYRILDIVTTFQHIGLEGVGLVLNKVVFVVTLCLFYAYSIASKALDWRPWITFGVSALLLLSPKTEVFTYVLLAPSYVFMVYWCAESEQPFFRKFGGVIVTVLAVVIASCRFTNPKWFVSESPMESIRAVGAFGLWILSGWPLASALRTRVLEWKGRKAGMPVA